MSRPKQLYVLVLGTDKVNTNSQITMPRSNRFLKSLLFALVVRSFTRILTLLQIAFGIVRETIKRTIGPRLLRKERRGTTSTESSQLERVIQNLILIQFVVFIVDQSTTRGPFPPPLG